MLSQLAHCSAAKYCSDILAMPSLIFICGFCKASCAMQIIPVYLQVCAEEEIPGAWSFCFPVSHYCYVGCIAPPLRYETLGFCRSLVFCERTEGHKISVCLAGNQHSSGDHIATCMQTFLPKSHQKSISRQRRCPLKASQCSSAWGRNSDCRQWLLA